MTGYSLDPTVSAFTVQSISPWRRAVFKIGSSLLASDQTGLSPRNALALAHCLTALWAKGREVVLVSSGAVAAGRSVVSVPLSLGIAHRQALAALGQAQLIGLWQLFFDRPVAQVLLTRDDLLNRRRYLNARETLEELLRLGALPVINENDTVCVDELKFGDNDNLAAIVAALVNADALFIATDIDGLYTADPHRHPDATPCHVVKQVTEHVLASAQDTVSRVGTGGMRTKLEAAVNAGRAGIWTYLFNGRNHEVVRSLAHDRLHGTVFHPALQENVTARKTWLAHLPIKQGARILLDTGAAHAIMRQGASLLPGGIIAVEGCFQRGDMIALCRSTDQAQQPVAKGIVHYSSDEVAQIAGHNSEEIAVRLGYHHGETVIPRDDLVVFDQN